MTLTELNKVTDYSNIDEIKVRYRTTDEEWFNPHGYMEVHEEELKKKENHWNVEFISIDKKWNYINDKEIIVIYLDLQKKN